MADQSSTIPTYKVDFTYSKLQALLTDENAGKKPVYIADYKNMYGVEILSAEDKKPVGKGKLHAFHTHADYELHGHVGKLQPLSKLKTKYTHLSYVYSDTDQPVAMTWTTKSSFSTWDFICLDEQQNAVARFSSNTFYVKKIGKIEFLGPKALSREAREEIIVVGLTLYSTMILRMSNPANLVGAMFSKTGPLDKPSKPTEDDNSLRVSMDTSHPKGQDVELVSQTMQAGKR